MLLIRKERLIDEKENNENDNSNDGAKKRKIMFDNQIKIRQQIIEEFLNRSLEAPVQMIGKSLDGPCTNHKPCLLCSIDMIHRSETNKTNRNDVEYRKELYTRLSVYLDRRKVRNDSLSISQ